MHVHVYGALGHLNLQHRQGISALWYQGLIGIVDGLGNGPILDNAGIDDIGLPVAGTLEKGRLGDKASDFDFFILKGYRQQRICRLRTIDGPYGVKEVALARGHHGFLVVIYEVELDIRPGQGQFHDEVVDVGPLRMVGLQKLFAGRSIEEQVLHLDGGAQTTASLGKLWGFATADFHPGAQILPSGPGQQGKAGHRSNGRQSLSPEAKGTDSI